MLIERIIELQLRGPGPPSEHVLRQLVIFMTKQISSGKSSSGLLFTAKMQPETMHLTSPYVDQITYN